MPRWQVPIVLSCVPNLSVGGITPSYGLLKQVLNNVHLPVFVLIRPRSGDFVYSEEEFNTMKLDIEICKQLGASGIVSGVLDKDGSIDMERTAELLELSRPLEFTFHRAFDELDEPHVGMEQLISLGVNRILTSGQQSSAEEGLELLKVLVEQSNNRIDIMAGAGIYAQNVSKFKMIGIKEVHASASSPTHQDSGLFYTPQTVSDPKKIKALLNAL
jgi:copper homeostasis protein